MKRAFATFCAAALAVATLGGLAMLAGGSFGPAKAAVGNPCTSQSTAAARAKCKSFKVSAPGDEYFGKMKLSYLGINNTFKDNAVRAGDFTTDSGVISRVNFADDALRAWASKYPNDPQLSRSYYLAVSAFKKIYTQPAQQKAWSYMNLLAKRYPSTWFGKQMKTAIAAGFVEQWYAEAEPCPTPRPRGFRPTPGPTPTPPPGPNQPIITILIPACIPPTPTPGPVPTFTLGPPVPLPTGPPARSPAPLPTATRV